MTTFTQLRGVTPESFAKFVEEGWGDTANNKNFRTTGELKSMLDLARNEILTHRGGTGPTACAGPAGKSDMAKLEADFNACKQAKAAAKPGSPMPIIGCMSQKATQARQAAAKPAAAPASAKAAAPAAKPAATMTAAQWLAQHGPPTLTRVEWQKLDAGDRAKFFRSGGKLID